ncbi:hypothetical protein J8273_1504 [Carpediemonas membranifera]|uniref:Uncharacterized protein n=1 Tax=Carpediemonas membranifera TaxID=201153 RepID=A0A8J6B1L8_9EUKA|nr:hypothetical protein J8273_1504 [Carpediemonas membranifera]|eukprot:KAG9396510.1 hypothetical protein J8273_1504 [Carpediemonas membranifera]
MEQLSEENKETNNLLRLALQRMEDSDKAQKKHPVSIRTRNLPSRFGLRDEAEFLYDTLEDIQEGRIADMDQLQLSLAARIRYLRLKDDNWDEGTPTRFQSKIRTLITSESGIISQNAIEEAAAAAMAKGTRRSFRPADKDKRARAH